MKIFFMVLSFLTLAALARAQDLSKSQTGEDYPVAVADDAKWLQNRIGLYGSFFSGYGLSYQRQLKNGVSLRTQFFGFGNSEDDDYGSDEIRLAYGADVQYNLQRSRKTRLYVLTGSFYDYYESENNYPATPSGKKDYDIERYINVGVGLGIELIAWQHVSFSIEGGYYGRFGNNNVTTYRIVNGQEIRSREKQTPKSFGFGVGGGIFYAF